MYDTKFYSSTLWAELTATLMWNHTDKGPCFTNITFSYNVTWYPVVCGVPLRGEGYTITNLMNGTDYQVELFGFTSSNPVVYSEVATVLVIFTAEGVYMCHMYVTVHRSCCHDNGHLKDDSTTLRSIPIASCMILNSIVVHCGQSMGIYESHINICGNFAGAFIIII